MLLTNVVGRKHSKTAHFNPNKGDGADDQEALIPTTHNSGGGSSSSVSMSITSSYNNNNNNNNRTNNSKDSSSNVNVGNNNNNNNNNSSSSSKRRILTTNTSTTNSRSHHHHHHHHHQYRPPVPIVSPTAASRPDSAPRSHHSQNSHSNTDSKSRSNNNVNQNATTGNTSVESEVFLPNPRTGGFDYTPAQRDYLQHTSTTRRNMRHHHQSLLPHHVRDDDETTLHDSDVYTTFSTTRPSATIHYNHKPLIIRQPDTADESTKIAAATATTSPLSSMLSPRSRNSFQRYFHTKATKTPNDAPLYSSPETEAATNNNAITASNVTPSPNKLKKQPSATSNSTKKHTKMVMGAFVQQLKSSLTKSPSRNKGIANSNNKDKRRHSNSDNHSKAEDSRSTTSSYVYYMKEDGALQPRAGTTHATYSPSTLPREQSVARPTSTRQPVLLMTPPRKQQSKKHHQQQQQQPFTVVSSSRSNYNKQQQQLLHESDSQESPILIQDDDDDDDEVISTPSSFWKRELGTPPRPRTGANSNNNNNDSGESLAAGSSCLDFSFSTMGNQTKDNGSSVWTFEAVSPVLLCGKNTTLDDTTTDGGGGGCEFSSLLQDSGFDADNDHTPNNDNDEDETTTLDLSMMHQDSLSMQSTGALLLTEEGLKRHNDKKMRQESVEPLTLRQTNGAGKLEKIVLQQKVERLQAKELQKMADASLEEERAARKRRQKEEAAEIRRQRRAAAAAGDSPDNLCRIDGSDHHRGRRRRSGRNLHDERTSPPRTPPKTPTSISPQACSTPTGSPGRESDADPTNNDHTKQQHQHNNTNKATSWLRRVLKPKKKLSPEELKQQWREKERQRVQRARMEKEQAERLERERIEELRQSYLEKQRQLEAAASEQPKERVIIDVDELSAANQRQQTAAHSRGYATTAPTTATVSSNSSSCRSRSQLSNMTAPTTTTNSSNNNNVITVNGLTRVSSTAAASTMAVAPPAVGYCSICHVRERSFMAIPCMHFSFCGECVEGRTVCPACSMENVSFSKVNAE